MLTKQNKYGIKQGSLQLQLTSEKYRTLKMLLNVSLCMCLFASNLFSSALSGIMSGASTAVTEKRLSTSQHLLSNSFKNF